MEISLLVVVGLSLFENYILLNPVDSIFRKLPLQV